MKGGIIKESQFYFFVVRKGIPSFGKTDGIPYHRMKAARQTGPQGCYPFKIFGRS